MADLLQNSELKVIANAGHLPSLETPQETSQALIRWLQA
jgi:pimeloyl-ACP methyl ester carboxylesterase